MSRRKTLDAFPNYLSGSVLMSAANTATNSRVSTPIPRLATSGARPTIMEILWIDIEFTATDVIADGDAVELTFSTGATPSATQRIDDGSVIARLALDNNFVTSGMVLMRMPFRLDLQSKDGYGQLLASDSFNVRAESAGQAAAVNFRWRMYYRFVQVPMAEYIGIVQSQSST